MPILKTNMKKEDANNNFGVASVVLGITGIAVSFLIIPPFILGALGLIFGLIQRKRLNNNWALWGVILSLAAILLSILIIYLINLIVGDFNQTIEQCIANPNLPGCESIMKLLEQQNAIS